MGEMGTYCPSRFYLILVLGYDVYLQLEISSLSGFENNFYLRSS